MLDWLWDWLKGFLFWLLDLVLWLPRKLWELFLDALASFIEWLPVPDFIENAGLTLSGIPPGVAYYAGIIMLPEGLVLILSASVLRFLIRRLPVIG